MSNLQQQQDQTTTITAANGDGNVFYPKLGGISTTAPSPPLSTTLADQTLYENYSLKWDEASLEQKMAALKLETQKQLINEFILRKAQMQNAPLTYPTEIHLRTSKAPSQRNRELYKTALCDFWSAGIPCRFGERCWFAHGPHELRIARFVYPGLHPYDYEVRMNTPNTLSSCYGRRLWNMEQSYAATNAQPTPTTITPMGQNVPIGYERKLRRISPIHENVNSKSWRTAQRVSDGDSGIGSTGTNNSPEINAKYRENMDTATYQFSPFHETFNGDSRIVPLHLQRPLDTLTSREQPDFSRNEAYNHWLSTGAIQPAIQHNIQLATGLEQTSWWPDTISNVYPYINRPSQNIQLNHSAAGSMSDQCYSMCIEPTADKVEI
uniref:C3H1-type domain-containing protein n=1 Tax=Elaeophora elaphi TaxID=1147741 RepID=A0A0R3RWS8_9BILA